MMGVEGGKQTPESRAPLTARCSLGCKEKRTVATKSAPMKRLFNAKISAETEYILVEVQLGMGEVRTGRGENGVPRIAEYGVPIIG